MQPFIVFSLLAALSFALSNLTYKFTSKHKINNPWVLQLYSALTLLPFLLLIPIFFPVVIPQIGWQYIFLYALVFFIGEVFFIKAIYHLDVSSFSSLFQLQSGLIAVLAYFFLGERFPVQNYYLILIMLVGSVLVTLDEQFKLKSFFQLAVGFILLQQIFHALSNLFAGFGLKSMSSFAFIFWGDLTAILLTLLVIPLIIGFKNIKTSFVKIKPLFFAGFFSTVGATSLFTAFQSNLTISSALSLLTAPIALVLSVILSFWKPSLLEHHSLKVYVYRTIGMILILFATINIAIG
ncbi:MAG: DMT family transporter [Candidatus Beckwithbacteria bacterium]